MDDLVARVDALKGKRKLRREDEAAAKEAKRVAMRKSMPVVAGMVDELREVFGAGVSVLAATENGKTVRAERQLRYLGIDEVV